MKNAKTEDPKQKKVNPRLGKFVLYQALLVAVFVWAALASGDAMVRREQTCLMCHEMSTAVKAWQASSHEKIACVECHHKEPGYYGFILGIPHKVTDLVTHVSGNYHTPITAKSEIEGRVCQRCHVSWRGVSPAGDLIVPHDQHLKKGIECAKCHTNVVHGMQVQGKFMRRPPMTLCLTCHAGGGNNKEAPVLACRQCHTEKAVPENHVNKVVWKSQHSVTAKKNPKYCMNCHGWRPDYCNDCHKGTKPSSHMEGHSASTLTEAQQKTYMTRWKTLHSTSAAVEKTGCLVCHNKQSFCYKCHDPFTD